MKIHVGTSGYGYKEWKGKFYPEKISPGDMLSFYSRRFRAVEINNTFYHMPKESVLDENPANEIISTAAWGYLRLRRSDYTDDDLSQWMGKILSQKWERAFVFFKHEEEAKGPEMAMRFQELADSRIKRKFKTGRSK